MNKKIIAIAIASALTAPAAMADLTISGAFVGEMVSRDSDAATTAETAGQSTLTFDDGGKNTIAFSATSGDVYGKLGLDVGPGAGQTLGGTATLKYRDWYIGHKFGNMSLQFGTMNGAVKNLEKDAYIATFLQTRNTYAEAATATKYGSSSYISNLLQYKGKVGPGTLIVQYNPTSDTTTAADEGHTGVSYAAKSGGVSWYVGYNTGEGSDVDSNDDTNMKLGASMKFGAAKVGLNYTTADDNGTEWDAIAIDATMDMGNGLSINANYGSTSANAAGKTAGKEGTTTRLAVMKSLNKNAWIYGGMQDNKPKNGASASEVGVGVGIKF